MTYETAIELAHQRMREIGKTKDQYHIEPVCVYGTEREHKYEEIKIKAYNSIYFLVNYQNYFGFIILSDSGYFNADNYRENTSQEFTGLIRILKRGTWNMEGGTPTKAIDFIKVTIH